MPAAGLRQPLRRNELASDERHRRYGQRLNHLHKLANLVLGARLSLRELHQLEFRAALSGCQACLALRELGHFLFGSLLGLRKPTDRRIELLEIVRATLLL